jgi:hypothetical protein
MVQHVDSDSDYDDASDGSSDEEYAEGDRRLRKKRPYVPKPGVEVFIVSLFLNQNPFTVAVCMLSRHFLVAAWLIMFVLSIYAFAGWPDALNEAGHAAGSVQCLWRHH